MWFTSKGNRTLEGAEAALFAEGLCTLIDDASNWDFEEYPMGINAYDQLTPGQQISTLQTIAHGLLSENVKPIELTAALEGAIVTVFRQIEDRLEVELEDSEFGTGWRVLILAARTEAGAEDLPTVDCNDMDEWQFQIDQLEGSILGDNDYTTSELTMDLPPEQAKLFKEHLGISDDYIQTIPDDLNQEQMTAAIVEIRKLYSRFLK